MFTVKKTIKCDICDASVTPRRDYTVQTNTGFPGVLASPLCFDVMDCPVCGCQITLKVRETVKVEDDEEAAEE